ncbi:MAG TPA: hypothetical protein VND93_04865 [Myxococcales bacterium]|nr:hypothetical protein [Myxococcales bacterium]
MGYPRNELAADLRRLSARSLASKDDLKKWYAEAKKITDRLGMMTFDVDGPDLGQHYAYVFQYIADAEIRLRDPKLAALQNAKLAEVLQALEQS